MEYKKFKDKIFVRIDSGEEIVESLTNLCKKLDIKAGTISGIGATNNATIGLFDIKAKKYLSREIVGDHEIIPVYGNISTMNNEPYLHLHINLCNSENKSFGGHLNSAIVSATFEGVIDIIDGKIERKYDDKSGLNLLKL